MRNGLGNAMISVLRNLAHDGQRAHRRRALEAVDDTARLPNPRALDPGYACALPSRCKKTSKHHRLAQGWKELLAGTVQADFGADDPRGIVAARRPVTLELLPQRETICGVRLFEVCLALAL